MATKIKQTNKKNNKVGVLGVVHISATFNNTIITITDLQGNTISWASAGSVGFKGSKRSSTYASQLLGENWERT